MGAELEAHLGPGRAVPGQAGRRRDTRDAAAGLHAPEVVEHGDAPLALPPGYTAAPNPAGTHTALLCTALHCSALHCTALHCTALRCTRRAAPHATAGLRLRYSTVTPTLLEITSVGYRMMYLLPVIQHSKLYYSDYSWSGHYTGL